MIDGSSTFKNDDALLKTRHHNSRASGLMTTLKKQTLDPLAED